MKRQHGFLSYGRLRAVALVALASPGLVALPPGAHAGPPLYASSFVVGNSQAECLENTRKVLIQAGIRQDDISKTTTQDRNGQNVQNGWSADHPTENVSLVFECDARNGMGAFGVAGANNDITYKIYQRVWDLWMK